MGRSKHSGPGAVNYKGKESESSKHRREHKKANMSAEEHVKKIREYGNKMPTNAGAPKRNNRP